jgi:hypothetical protein
MGLVHIKFQTRSDEVRGVEELAMNTRITAYRGGVYAVRQTDLQRLEAGAVAYRLATDEEVEAALGSVRHPVAPVL